MTELSLWFLIIAIVLISFTLLMFGLSVFPWCAHLAVDTSYYTASWKRMAIPENESFTVTIPPLPPYFFESDINHDFSEIV